MRHKNLLLLLAEHLSTLDHSQYSSVSHDKDALHHAGTLKEFKKAGFITAANDDRKGSTIASYKGLQSTEAAARFFDITAHEAAHLFSDVELDVFGHQQKTFFTKGTDSRRDEETPQWVAGRIKAFVRMKDGEEMKQAS